MLSFRAGTRALIVESRIWCALRRRSREHKAVFGGAAAVGGSPVAARGPLTQTYGFCLLFMRMVAPASLRNCSFWGRDTRTEAATAPADTWAQIACT